MNDLYALGFALADVRLSGEQCDYIASSLPSMADNRGGVRGLLSHPTVLQLLRHRQLGHFLWSLTGRELVVVNAKLFDAAYPAATPKQWHQDRVVAVRERMAVQGYGPWTTKIGVPHVEPPSSVLEQMLVIRVYLDDCVAGNGALRVLPGTHEAGKLTEEAIRDLVGTATPVTPQVDKGMLLLMRPLLLHSVQTSPVRTHYRVLHLEFAPVEAISPLQWHSAVPLRRAA